MSGQIIDQIGQRGNTDYRDAVSSFNFLHGRKLALPAFLAVERDGLLKSPMRADCLRVENALKSSGRWSEVLY